MKSSFNYIQRGFAFRSFSVFLLGLASVLTLNVPCEGARPFIVGGRTLFANRPFRPGAAIEPPSFTAPSAIIERPRTLSPSIEPAKGMSVLESVSPPRVVPHYLPKEGDYTPHHYPGVTVVAIPPISSYTPDPNLGGSFSLSRGRSNYPATTPGPRIVTPDGLRPGHDPYRPSPFDPDVTRRQGFKRF